MHRRTIARTVTTLAATAALVAGLVATAQGAQAQPTRATLADSAPNWLGHAHHTGKTNDRAGVNLRIYLTPRGGLQAVKNAVAAVATPGSASYRDFVTPAQYRAAYEPTTATVNAVEAWLRSSGLRVSGVESSRRYISATGDVAAAQAAFGVSIQNYSHDGQNVQAPSGAASVPSSVAGAVLAVGGLDTTKHVAKTTPIPPPASFVNARPCSIYYGQLQAKYQADYKTPLPKFNGKTLPYAVCGYTGPQFRAAYEGNSSLDGSGVTVASTLWYLSSTIRSDISTYAERHGDGSYAKGQFTISKPPNGYNIDPACDPSGSFAEEALDLEAMHAMAPAANVIYYSARSCYDTDLIDTLARVVDEHKAQIVSNSWGEPEEGESADSIAAYEQVFLQGSMEGISFLFSSGDSGDELANTGIMQTDYPTSDPLVTSVGGTSTAIGAAGNLAWQTGWGTVKYSLSSDGKSWTPVGFLYGAGGGFSSLNNRPPYQNGVVPASAPPGRAVPDVAMDADPTTGMLIGLTQTFPEGVHYGEYRIGGTSLASPLFAGMTALLLQHVGHGLGLLNPTIYAQAGSGTFTDVKGTPKDAGNVRVDYANSNNPSGGLLYSVRTFNQDSSLKIAPGWDPVTGIGSPNPGWLTSVSP